MGFDSVQLDTREAWDITVYNWDERGMGFNSAQLDMREMGFNSVQLDMREA
jgi:hypothetical protein